MLWDMGSKKSLIEFLFKDKPLKLILALSDGSPKNITQLYRKVKTTYSHTLNLLSVLYSLDIIEFKKVGREKQVKLTEKGEKLVEILKDLIREFY